MKKVNLIKNAPSKQDGEKLFKAGKEFARIIKG